MPSCSPAASCRLLTRVGQTGAGWGAQSICLPPETQGPLSNDFHTAPGHSAVCQVPTNFCPDCDLLDPLGPGLALASPWSVSNGQAGPGLLVETWWRTWVDVDMPTVRPQKSDSQSGCGGGAGLSREMVKRGDTLLWNPAGCRHRPWQLCPHSLVSQLGLARGKREADSPDHWPGPAWLLRVSSPRTYPCADFHTPHRWTAQGHLFCLCCDEPSAHGSQRGIFRSNPDAII